MIGPHRAHGQTTSVETLAFRQQTSDIELQT